MQKRFNSKIDIWLVSFIAIVIVPMILPVIFLDFLLVGLIILTSVTAFIVYIFVSTCYFIDFSNNTLFITSGFGKHGITIGSITSITHTNSILSAPALSLDRIEIRTNDYRRVVISPKRRQEFIADILKINPNVEVK